MRLVDELQALKCEMDEGEFLDGLADVYSQEFRDLSVDNLFCNPHLSRKFCKIVCRRFGIPGDGIADEMILRRLMNLRKSNRSAFPKCPSLSRFRLATELGQIPADVDPERFRSEVNSTYVRLYSAWAVDRFVGHWRDASHFCGVVAVRLSIPRDFAVDNLILRTLMNSRRSGSLNASDRMPSNVN